MKNPCSDIVQTIYQIWYLDRIMSRTIFFCFLVPCEQCNHTANGFHDTDSPKTISESPGTKDAGCW